MSPKPSAAVRPHVTEDLTEAQVAEAAFADEVVVSWHEHGEKLYGIIVGYSDPDGDHTFASEPGVDLGEVGMFSIDPVQRGPDGSWREIPRAKLRELKRTGFVVFGPANRDPGDKEAPPSVDESMTASDLRGLVGDHLILVTFDGMTKRGILGEDVAGDEFPVRLLDAEDNLTDEWERMDRHHFQVMGLWELTPDTPDTPEAVAMSRPLTPPSSTERQARLAYSGHYTDLGKIEIDGRWRQFTSAAEAILRIGMSDFMSNEPTFQVRLDVSTRAPKSHETEAGSYIRSYRLLVRPAMTPMMHDEVAALLKIAEDHGLAVNLASGTPGLELRTPEDQTDTD